MGATKIQTGYAAWVRQEWMIDEEGDEDGISTTGLPVGSVAYTASGDYRVMYTGNDWVQTTSGGGGGGGASMTTATIDPTTMSLDMTAGALYAAFKRGPVMATGTMEGMEINALCVEVEYTPEATVVYGFVFATGQQPLFFEAGSADDYPAIGGGSDGENSGGSGEESETNPA